MGTLSNSLRAKPAQAARTLLGAFDRLEVEEQAAFLTLPLLLLYVEDHWYVKIPVVVLSLAGLLFSPLRKGPYFWFAIVCFTAAGLYYGWADADNHKYLITYWCLAFFFARLTPSEGALQTSARWLIGLAFLFAVVWKFLTPDFINGDFFQYTFLFDERFSGKLKLFGALAPDAVDYNLLAKGALTAYDSRLYEVDLLTNPRWGPWVTGLVWWTLVVEGLIALCFLLPKRSRLAPLGDVCLILFLLSTYLVAPVIGFGSIIATMGIIQCDASRWKTRLSYIVVLLLMQLYRLPWASIADSMSQ
ncbi:MAG: hypothetical protein M3416_00830 [Acidobacteriota bacterium]|nr:hypothetical protein [Acidobacteriota bacterium]